MTPRGDVKVDFFHEAQSMPDEVTNSIAPDGQLGEELDRSPQRRIERTMLVGMMLTAEQAESIGRWLQEKARESRRLKGGDTIEPDATTTH